MSSSATERFTLTPEEEARLIVLPSRPEKAEPTGGRFTLTPEEEARLVPIGEMSELPLEQAGMVSAPGAGRETRPILAGGTVSKNDEGFAGNLINAILGNDPGLWESQAEVNPFGGEFKGALQDPRTGIPTAPGRSAIAPEPGIVGADIEPLDLDKLIAMGLSGGKIPMEESVRQARESGAAGQAYEAELATAPDRDIWGKPIAGSPGMEVLEGAQADPWLDPSTVFAGAAGASGILAMLANQPLKTAASHALKSGLISALTEYPIGVVTEAVAEKYPKAALPVNLLLGGISGATLEKRALDALGPEQKAVMAGLEARKTAKGDVLETIVGAEEAQRVRGVEGAPSKTLAKAAEETDTPVAEATAKGQFRVIPADADLTKPPDHWTTNSLEDARVIKKRLEESGNPPQMIVQIDEEAVKASGGTPKGKSPYETGADWIEAKKSLPKGSIVRIVEGGAEEGIAKSALQKQYERKKIQIQNLISELTERGDTKNLERAKLALKGLDIELAKEVKKIKSPGAGRVAGEAGEEFAGGPMAGSLRYGEKLPKYAASINLERIDSPYALKKSILDHADMYRAQIDAARRGVQTHAMTKSRAEELGMTLEDVLGRKPTQIWDDAESKAARDILVSFGDEVYEQGVKYMKSHQPEDLARLLMLEEKNAKALASVAGEGSEWGRSGSARRIMAEKGRVPTKALNAMYEALFEEHGGKKTLEEFALRLSQIDPHDTIAVNRYLRDAKGAKTSDKIFEAYINALLSNPVTQVRNIVGNTLTFMTSVAEAEGAAGVDFLRSMATGTPRERYFGESLPMIYGAGAGLKEGMAKAVWAFTNEMSTEGASKLETRTRTAIKGPVGRAVRVPGRFLLAADEFFKAVNREASMHQQAYRKAVEEGLTGDARVSRIADLVANPTDAMKAQATEDMLYRVFQKELGESGKKIQAVRDIPGLRYIVPFFRTPANIFKYGAERTPLAIPFIIRDAMKGNLKGGKLSDDVAKVVMGSAVGAAVFMLAKEGKITSTGPSNKTERESLYRTGWQPQSVKIGNQWVSYGGVEPLGMIMGLAADSAQVWDELNDDEKDDAAAKIVQTLAQNLTSKTFMKGLSDFLNAMTSPERYGESWTQKMAGAFVPSGVASVERAIDPTLRETEDISEYLQSRTPGLSKSLQVRRDIWGNPITVAEGGVAERLVSPFYRSEIKNDPADTEIVRLGLRIGKPTRKIEGIEDAEMTPAMYEEMITTAGPKAHQRILERMRMPNWKDIPDDIKGKLIKADYDNTINAEKSKYRGDVMKLKQEGR